MEYREIDFGVGTTIENAIKKLAYYKDKNIQAKGSFNGQILYSDIDTLDSAYRKITGVSFEDFKEKEKQRHLEYEKHKREHEEKIPELTKYWIEEGKKILIEDKWEYWEKCVPIRLNDFYEGMELKYCLDIIKILKETNNDFQKAKEVIENQGHSGMSFGLVCSMITSFYDKGKEFVEYARK